MGNASQFDSPGVVGVDSPADLQRMIGRLSAPGSHFSDGARQVSVDSVELCLCLLDEFDEVVMARRLALWNSRGDRLTVELRNRRLHQADFSSTCDEAAAAAQFSASSLSYAGAETLQAFLFALRAFCAPGGIWVRSSRAGSPADPDETGVSVGTLRYQLAQAPAGVAPEAGKTELKPPSSESGAGRSVLAGFIANDPPWLEAWVLVAGALDREAGGRADRLAGLSEALDAVCNRLAARGSQPTAVFLEATGELGEHLAFVADGPERLALLVSPSGKGAFLAHWSDWRRACNASMATVAIP